MLVLRGCGPKGYPGMPEVANMPLPKKLLAQGVRDMVRICDARMSGTAYGTVVLHVAPGGGGGRPAGAGARRRRHRARRRRAAASTLDVAGDELGARGRRRAATAAAYAAPARGWERLYVDHVLQADPGADLDFLVGGSGDRVSRESH